MPCTCVLKIIRPYSAYDRTYERPRRRGHCACAKSLDKRRTSERLDRVVLHGRQAGRAIYNARPPRASTRNTSAGEGAGGCRREQRCDAIPASSNPAGRAPESSPCLGLPRGRRFALGSFSPFMEAWSPPPSVLLVDPSASPIPYLILAADFSETFCRRTSSFVFPRWQGSPPLAGSEWLARSQANALAAWASLCSYHFCCLGPLQTNSLTVSMNREPLLMVCRRQA